MTNITVLDASALLALIQNEPGAELVGETISHEKAIILSVTLSEVIAKLAEIGIPEAAMREFQNQLPVDIIDFTQATASEAGLLRPSTRQFGLSLGDRACLATAKIMGNLAILTADKSWAKLEKDFNITVLRD